MAGRVDYNSVAPAYHGRYGVNPLPGVTAALKTFVRQLQPRRVLEVGCGTGHWLAELQAPAGRIFGLDQSAGMLAEARRLAGGLALIQGAAEELPWHSASFDLVFCVNALHHFNRPAAFVAEARRLLRPGGGLVIVGMNPHAGRDEWYLYDYFEGVREADLARFPSAGMMVDWLAATGFDSITWRGAAEHIWASQAGRAVLNDFFLLKTSTSQLTLLPDTAYTAGVHKIRAAVTAAEARGEMAVFLTNLYLGLLTGRVPASEGR